MRNWQDMTRPDARKAGFGARMFFWLVVLLGLVETPLGKGDLYAAGLQLLETSRLQISSGDLPSRHATTVRKQTATAMIEASRDAPFAWAIEWSGDEQDLLPRGEATTAAAPLSGGGFAAAAVPTGERRHAYAPRAPPAQA